MDVCVIDWMHDEVYFEQGSDVGYSIAECNLMQFIGLTDANGVKIFEGDRIVCSRYCLRSKVLKMVLLLCSIGNSHRIKISSQYLIDNGF